MLTPATIPDAFSKAECLSILALAEAAPAEEARLLGRQQDHNLRRAELVWVDDLAGAEWIMTRIVEVAARVNREVFGFDLEAFEESAQIAAYRSEKAGHFDWHADIGDGPLAARRKVTLVVQLSAADDYEGGALEVMPSSQVHCADRARGSATAFPAFLLHRVTPVTQGLRRSLTVWAHGPAFR